MSTKSKRKLIKQAKIGDVWFNVYVDTGLAGSAEFHIEWHPERNHRMVLGLDGIVDYAEAFERLLHETVEAALTLRDGTNYVKNNPRNYPAYVRFAFTHEDFQYAMQETAQFLMVVTPAWYKEVHKKYPNLPRFHGEKPAMQSKGSK